MDRLQQLLASLKEQQARLRQLRAGRDQEPEDEVLSSRNDNDDSFEVIKDGF